MRFRGARSVRILLMRPLRRTENDAVDDALTGAVAMAGDGMERGSYISL